MDHVISKFISGVHNLDTNENIPRDAAQDAKNFITEAGRMILARGRLLLGNDSGAGKIYGLHIGYKATGGTIKYRKAGTKIQYLNGSTWTDVVTGLTENAEYTFSNYSTLAGAFTIATGIDGIYKFNNANPGSYLAMYSASRNDKGYSFVDKGRMLMWNLSNASKTTLKQSWIDAQDGTVYTTVTAEVLGASGSQTYSGTVAAKTATRNIFAVVITGTTGGTAETFTDNKDGTLTSNKGGTGTINYTTGVYSVTFSAAVSAGNVTADYQWEDSNQKGITDFTFTSPSRVASEGNRITQDVGGDRIITVLIGPDGAYYSIKEKSVYRLAISADDVTFDNNVYRRDIGIPFLRAGASTSKGIVFMNTANPERPELTILRRNLIGDNIEPVTLCGHFDFSKYNYDDCCIDTYDRFIAVLCMSEEASNNDTILLCDITEGSKNYPGTVDITAYPARMLAKDGGNLYSGSPFANNVYQLFNGFDDDSYPIENYLISKGETYDREDLKKFRKKRFKGLIDPDQVVSVYVSYDDDDFSLVGTIRGDADYVDYSNPQTVGSNMVGEAQVGGDTGAVAYPYFMDIKMRNMPKFRKRSFKIVAEGIGYYDLEYEMDEDIFTFPQRLPKRFRQKQNVSLDGADTDQ